MSRIVPQATKANNNLPSWMDPQELIKASGAELQERNNVGISHQASSEQPLMQVVSFACAQCNKVISADAKEILAQQNLQKRAGKQDDQMSFACPTCQNELTVYKTAPVTAAVSNTYASQTEKQTDLSKEASTYNTYVDRHLVFRAVNALQDFAHKQGMWGAEARYLSAEHQKEAGQDFPILNNINCELHWRYGANQMAKAYASISIDQAGKFKFPRIFKDASHTEYPFEKEYIQKLEKECSFERPELPLRKTDTPVYKRPDISNFRSIGASMNATPLDKTEVTDIVNLVVASITKSAGSLIKDPSSGKVYKVLGNEDGKYQVKAVDTGDNKEYADTKEVKELSQSDIDRYEKVTDTGAYSSLNKRAADPRYTMHIFNILKKIAPRYKDPEDTPAVTQEAANIIANWYQNEDAELSELTPNYLYRDLLDMRDAASDYNEIKTVWPDYPVDEDGGLQSMETLPESEKGLKREYWVCRYRTKSLIGEPDIVCRKLEGTSAENLFKHQLKSIGDRIVSNVPGGEFIAFNVNVDTFESIALTMEEALQNLRGYLSTTAPGHLERFEASIPSARIYSSLKKSAANPKYVNRIFKILEQIAPRYEDPEDRPAVTQEAANIIANWYLAEDAELSELTPDYLYGDLLDMRDAATSPKEIHIVWPNFPVEDTGHGRQSPALEEGQRKEYWLWGYLVKPIIGLPTVFCQRLEGTSVDNAFRVSANKIGFGSIGSGRRLVSTISDDAVIVYNTSGGRYESVALTREEALQNLRNYLSVEKPGDLEKFDAAVPSAPISSSLKKNSYGNPTPAATNSLGFTQGQTVYNLGKPYTVKSVTPGQGVQIADAQGNTQIVSEDNSKGLTTTPQATSSFVQKVISNLLNEIEETGAPRQKLFHTEGNLQIKQNWNSWNETRRKLAADRSLVKEASAKAASQEVDITKESRQARALRELGYDPQKFEKNESGHDKFHNVPGAEEKDIHVGMDEFPYGQKRDDSTGLPTEAQKGYRQPFQEMDVNQVKNRETFPNIDKLRLPATPVEDLSIYDPKMVPDIEKSAVLHEVSKIAAAGDEDFFVPEGEDPNEIPERDVKFKPYMKAPSGREEPPVISPAAGGVKEMITKLKQSQANVVALQTEIKEKEAPLREALLQSQKALSESFPGERAALAKEQKLVTNYLGRLWKRLDDVKDKIVWYETSIVANMEESKLQVKPATLAEVLKKAEEVQPEIVEAINKVKALIENERIQPVLEKTLVEYPISKVQQPKLKSSALEDVVSDWLVDAEDALASLESVLATM